RGEPNGLLETRVKRREQRRDRRSVAVVSRPQRRRQLIDVIRLHRGVHVVVMANDRLQRRIRAVVHVRRAELDIAERRHTEEETRKTRRARYAFVTTACIERRGGTGSRPQLRHRHAGETLCAEERTVVARRAACGGEEEQGSVLRVEGQRVVLARQVAIEGGIRLRERLRLKGG